MPRFAVYHPYYVFDLVSYVFIAYYTNANYKKYITYGIMFLKNYYNTAVQSKKEAKYEFELNGHPNSALEKYGLRQDATFKKQANNN